MKRTLVVTDAADDLHLLTIEQMREAAGVEGSSQDTALQAMSLRIAASIMSECNITEGAGAEPTLKQETLTETFRQVCVKDLMLSRRHNVSITSITEDEVALSATDWLVDPESGALTRLCNDLPIGWNACKIVVVYQAGFATIPGDLKQAAMEFFRSAWLEKSRDPLVKRERVDIPGVEERETDYWVGAVPGQSSEGVVPDVVAGQLKRFRNAAVG